MHPPTAERAERIPVPFWKNRDIAQVPSAAELHRRYLRPVLGYVAARIGSGAEAEDVTAEVFAAAFVALDRCPRDAAGEGGGEGDDPVRAWLFGIARRKVADVLRRRSRRPEASLEECHPVGEGQQPEIRALADEAARTLRAILDDLPEQQREALRLKYLEGLSLVEIGRVLRRSPAAVGQLLHRARQAVRTRGGAYFGESPGESSGETVSSDPREKERAR